jgi:hypothetical protein
LSPSRTKKHVVWRWRRPAPATAHAGADDDDDGGGGVESAAASVATTDEFIGLPGVVVKDKSVKQRK